MLTKRSPFAWIADLARSSPWMLIAIALHLIVLAGAAVYYTTGRDAPREDTPIVLSQHAPRPVDELPVEPPKPPPRHLVPEPLDQPLTDIPDTYTPDEIPALEDSLTVGDPSSMLDQESKGEPTSTAIGVGKNGHAGWKTGPFGTRDQGPGAPHGDLRHKRGEFTDKEVLDGLRWLARHQNPDGSWSAATLHERCTSERGCGDPKAHYDATYDEGLTGLALLAFLGAGYSHNAQQFIVDPVTKRNYKVGEIVKSGLKWLVDHEREDGAITRDRVFVYNQALATMALAEDYGLSGERYFRDPAQRATNFLVAAQRPGPTGGRWGWRYAPRQDVEQFHRGDTLDADYMREIHDADTSVTGWCVMALKSAALVGLTVDPEALRGAAAFTKWTTANDGLVGYLDPKSAGASVTGPGDQFTYHPAGMSALGMCIRIFTEHDQDDAFLPLAAARLAADLPMVSADKLSVDYYYWYYGSLALNQFDGPDSPKRTGRFWDKWNKAMLESLRATVDGDTHSCAHGGWIVPDRWSRSGGPIYATAINVLTLEVYYRYDNALGAVRKVKAQTEKK